MSSIPLHYIDLRAFCYVTEEEERVEDALRLFLPEEFEIERAGSEGHYGDPILVLSARVESTDGMRTVLDALGELADEQFARVVDELDERVNENCAFFLTLDKQAAFNGAVELGDGITFRGKVEAYPAKKESAVENVEGLLAEL
ncbi:RNA-binding protein [Halovenus sp. WSH3]|uniref:RNA-binding protein n=1 Tax=Halovenus carboxidivorans TaxID=2692199 RepID=A0A6B0SYT0_9EURY|nr:RNA-binding protein [Halovenus carboxidivorans]MXR50754.1 RNA-binding protein [Halovenus carboxidivorans]